VRQLTFEGYLARYVRGLSGSESLAPPRLVNSPSSHPRVVEPLLLWAAKTGRSARLAPLLGAHPKRQRELAWLVELNSTGELEGALETEDPRLRPEFAKVWRSYRVRARVPERETELELEVRRQALQLEKEKRVTRYRMAKDLGLNPGNLHAFLAQANPRKLSRKRALELLEYLRAA
jgi:hypothetical protein